MVALPAELSAELKTLRKGRGIDVPRIGERVGTALREVCGIETTDSAGEIRRKLATRLEALAGQLPIDLRVSVLVALAIHPEARLPFYQERIRWVARYLKRDERTARRRVDDGIQQLAEIAAAPAEPVDDETGTASPGWRVEELRSILLLDQPGQELIELRKIVVEREALDTLELSFTLPRGRDKPDSPHELGVQILYGGTLMWGPAESSERFGFMLQLPRRLERRETYEFGIRFAVPEGQPVRPHYTCVSKHVYDSFDLRVRFDRENLPQEIRKVEDAFQRDVDDPMLGGDVIVPDPAGEINVHFRHLTPGLAYGVRWLE
jgi:hypothetical protein